MGALDLNAIAVALALAYDPTNLDPPTDLRPIAKSTATPGNAISNTPMVIVTPSRGEVTVGGTGTSGVHDLITEFYYDKREADSMRYATVLGKWVGPLLLATYGASALGLTDQGTLGYRVLKALPVEWEIGVLVYAGIEYEGIRITVRVWTDQTDRPVP
jgi:hypothetical protein